MHNVNIHCIIIDLLELYSKLVFNPRKHYPNYSEKSSNVIFIGIWNFLLPFLKKAPLKTTKLLLLVVVNVK